jgi:hypothetical protein
LTLRAASGTRSCVKSEPPSPPREADVDGERPLERLLPELIRRIIEAGVDRLSEGPENVRRVVADLKLPREALAAILSQLDETKSGLYRVVAREVRDILSETSLADELAKALTSLSFEIRTTVRFVPNDARKRPSPEVRSSVAVHRDSETPVSSSEPPSTPQPPESSRKPQ